MVSNKTQINSRGTVTDTLWEGKCREPGDPCSAGCETDRTCYKCDIPPTYEGYLVRIGFQLLVNWSGCLQDVRSHDQQSV